MSTSCYILFARGDNFIRTYKHYDGYPSNVVPLLRQFYQWYPRTRDLEYLSATWFYYCKRLKEVQMDTESAPAPVEATRIGGNSSLALSYGICADETVHSGISHVYEVDLHDDVVHHYVDDEPLRVRSTDDLADRNPENTFPLRFDAVAATSGQSTQDASARADGGQTMTIGTWSGCGWCASSEDRYWMVKRGAPAGDYLGVGDDETIELCDACMDVVADCLGDDVDVGDDIANISGGE